MSNVLAFKPAPVVRELSGVSEVQSYLARVGHETGGTIRFRGLNKAVLKLDAVREGYFLESHTFEFARDKTGEVTVYDAFGNKTDELAPTESEAAAIKEALSSFPWPESRTLPSNERAWPKEWHDATEYQRWVFRNEDGEAVMLQIRGTDERGQRFFLPVSFWSDETYRFLEPDGDRPIFNLHLVAERKATTIFVHEGAKAAAAAQAIAGDPTSKHPWAAAFGHAVHIAYLGGANAGRKTDFSRLKKQGVQRVYVLADNDRVGIEASLDVAKQFDCVVYRVLVGQDFPPSWDIADPMPAKFFNKAGAWHGPTFESCVFPATRATFDFLGSDGKNHIGFNRPFGGEWFYALEEKTYVHSRFPHIQYDEDRFNAKMASLSGAKNTAEFFRAKAGTSVIDATTYRPDAGHGVITKNNRQSFNVYRPYSFAAIHGDASPFYEFLEYLVPDDDERKELIRWLFTMLASPETRMHYSCLIWGETQGTGKSTLADILYRIVGPINSEVVSPRSLSGDFNPQWENKRLVLFHEMYEGGTNFKTTNGLKTVLTDRTIFINKKYKDQRAVENWVHIFAASNASHALDLDDRDRRWLVVSTTEQQWPKEKFDQLHDWLFDDIGCNVILAEARKFNDYVKKGDRAPHTNSKAETVYQSKSAIELAIEDFRDWAENYVWPDGEKGCIAIETTDIQDYLERGKAQKFNKWQTNVRSFKTQKWEVLNQKNKEFGGYRPSIRGKQRKVLISPAMIKLLRKAKDDEERHRVLSQRFITQSDIGSI